jgi:hypothetical protein
MVSKIFFKSTDFEQRPRTELQRADQGHGVLLAKILAVELAEHVQYRVHPDVALGDTVLVGRIVQGLFQPHPDWVDGAGSNDNQWPGPALVDVQRRAIIGGEQGAGKSQQCSQDQRPDEHAHLLLISTL